METASSSRSVAILYESDEWSSYALEAYAREFGVPAFLVNLEEDEPARLDACALVVNRIFASAVFRGHGKSLERMPPLLDRLAELGIPVLNAARAHFYETDKALATRTLREHGLPVPAVHAVLRPGSPLPDILPGPCILKPNCGGRTTHTHIVRSRDELARRLAETPPMDMLLEQYVEPAFGFITRVEVIGGTCRLIVKRGLAPGGLSAYHLGSVYAPYPECSDRLRRTAEQAMALLDIEMGSLDIIENEHGCSIIDVNAVSNASEDNTAMFSFNLMRETARHIARRYAGISREMKR